MGKFFPYIFTQSISLQIGVFFESCYFYKALIERFSLVWFGRNKEYDGRFWNLVKSRENYSFYIGGFRNSFFGFFFFIISFNCRKWNIFQNDKSFLSEKNRSQELCLDIGFQKGFPVESGNIVFSVFFRKNIYPSIQIAPEENMIGTSEKYNIGTGHEKNL